MDFRYLMNLNSTNIDRFISCKNQNKTTEKIANEDEMSNNKRNECQQLKRR